MFVKIYYRVSPSIAGILQENKTSARVVRKVLDKMIEKIRQ
jgi:hypothetical protein